MAIKINDIPTEGLTLALTDKLDLFDQGAPTTAVTAALLIKPEKAGIFSVAGTVQAEIELECSRCLKKFLYQAGSELNFDLVPEGALDLSAEHELGR